MICKDLCDLALYMFSICLAYLQSLKTGTQVMITLFKILKSRFYLYCKMSGFCFSNERSRGFGFVTFKKAHMVDDAQRDRPHKIDKKEVEAKRAMPREV